MGPDSGQILSRDRSYSVLSFEPASFHPIAADLHVAPAARVIFAGIKKEPATVGIPAGANPLYPFGSHKSFRAARKQPKREFRRFRRPYPLPAETLT